MRKSRRPEGATLLIRLSEKDHRGEMVKVDNYYYIEVYHYGQWNQKKKSSINPIISPEQGSLGFRKPKIRKKKVFMHRKKEKI